MLALMHQRALGLAPARGSISHASDRVPFLIGRNLNLTAVRSSDGVRNPSEPRKRAGRASVGARALGKNDLSGLGTRLSATLLELLPGAANAGIVPTHLGGSSPNRFRTVLVIAIRPVYMGVASGRWGLLFLFGHTLLSLAAGAQRLPGESTRLTMRRRWKRRAQRSGRLQKSAIFRAVSRLISGHTRGRISVPCIVPITWRQRAWTPSRSSSL